VSISPSTVWSSSLRCEKAATGIVEKTAMGRRHSGYGGRPVAAHCRPVEQRRDGEGGTVVEEAWRSAAVRWGF